MNIILTTLNARFAHASLGLRYLFANLKELQPQAEIIEFTIQQDIDDILTVLYEKQPEIIGLGVYIWNIEIIARLVKNIRVLMPEVKIIIGGPEVSYEYEGESLFADADYLITGWGDISFYELCTQILNQQAPDAKVVTGIEPKLETITFPYRYYSDHDLKHRTIYVEASRGCPFRCEFCISSLEKTAWGFPLDTFLEEMEALYVRGLRQFKFVDRTFNLKREFTSRILNFFLDKLKDENSRVTDALFLHFELVPDFLSDELKALILRFPAGTLQFEIGIQTLNPETQLLISRKTDLVKARENISWLSKNAQVHLHVDLIAGLPGENLTQFAAGFNELWSWEPQEIQLGILKRLKGVPIARHTEAFGYKYSQIPPYSILENFAMDYGTINQMKRAAKYWDLVANSGRFGHTLPLLLKDDAFGSLWQFSDWLYKQVQRTHSIALDRLFVLLFEYLTQEKKYSFAEVQDVMREDFMRVGLQGWPKYLGEKPATGPTECSSKKITAQPKRQQQHQ